MEKQTFIHNSSELQRRICMLDVIIVLVTIIMFVAFIGFTEGVDRL